MFNLMITAAFTTDSHDASELFLNQLGQIGNMFIDWVGQIWHLISGNWVLSLNFALALLSLAVWIIRRIMNIKP